MNDAPVKMGSGIIETFMEFPLPLALLDLAGRPEVVNRVFSRRYGTHWPALTRLLAAAQGAETGWQELRRLSPAANSPEVRVRTIRTQHRILLVIDEVGDDEHRDAMEMLQERVTELEQLAATDHLTGAWNRAHLDRVIPSELERSQESRQPLSLILLDIDHFKMINDSFGHAAGDAVLRELVKVVREQTRASDLLFRWGGEEFVVLAASAGYRRAEAIAENLRKVVAGHHFKRVGAVTVSLGVAEHDGKEDTVAWFHRLDDALYQAKRCGRNVTITARRGNSDAWAAERGSTLLHLVWQEGYECGDPTIDAEHRELFRLANALIDVALQEKSEPAAVKDALGKLVAHTRQHFADEEAILERLDYAQLNEHRRAHAGLIRRAEKMSAQLDAGVVPLGAIVEYLAQHVVARHMMTVDRAFYPLFRKETDLLQPELSST